MDKLYKILLLLVIVLPLILIIAHNIVYGPQWDVMAQYLNGKALYDLIIYHNVSVYSAFAGEYQDNLLYYFEPYREPLPTPIFAALYPLGQGLSIPIYLGIVYAIYAFAVYKIGKALETDVLLAFLMLTNIYVVIYFFNVTSKEALSAAFLLLALAYLLRKSEWSGLFFGLAAISKYPTLIFLPMVLLLWDRKKVPKAIALEIIPAIPWLIFNYSVYGSPIYSYLAAISTSISGAAPIYLGSVLQVLAYPVIFAAIALICLKLANKKVRIPRYTLAVIAIFIVLSFIGYIEVLPYHDPLTQARYGYLFSLALLLPALYLLNIATSSRFKKVVILLAVITVIIDLIALCAYVQSGNTPVSQYYNPSNPNGLYVHAGSVLASLGYGGCRVVSDTWIPMVYSGYDVYSPFITYLNSNLSTTLYNANHSINITQAVDQRLEYPILVFKYPGVPNSLIRNLNSSTLAYKDANISVYLPNNAICVKN